MDLQLFIFSLVESIIFLIIILIALVYSIPIICVRRFHQHNNIFTLNVCVATILCSFSWFPIYGVFMFYNPLEVIAKIFRFFNIAETIFTIQVPFSFVIASIHRYCSLVYHTKIFFRRKRWLILCIGGQWMLGFVLTIPNLICLFRPCGRLVWPSVYAFGSVVMIPLIICLIINMLIYHHVRTSSHRVQPQTISIKIQQENISHRDIVLLRHMVLMFCVFVGGWAPTFILPIVNYYTPVNSIVSSCCTIWCELAVLFDVMDLFWYNHELRKYFKEVCQRRFRL